jgi:outer membrane lipoprotein LolB
MRHLFVTALLLAGCAAVPPATSIDVESALPARWTLQGRIGVQSGEQSLSGQIHWQHGQDSDDLLMTSPLGQGVARILRDSEGVVLELPNQPALRALDADALTRDALGYTLPVAGLTWWVLARPDPGRAYEARRDGAGRLMRLEQDGWVIDYLQYASGMPGRPRKLVVTRDDLEIRLVTDSWEVE